MTWQFRRLVVHGFRGLVDLELPEEASPLGRCTLLVGPHGAGKTSTLQAIEWALTGDVRGPRGKARAQAYYTPDEGEAYVGLELGRDGVPLRIARKLNKTHTLLVDGADLGGVGAAEEQLERTLGFPAEQVAVLLRASEFIRLSPAQQAAYVLELVDIKATPDTLIGALPKGKRRAELAHEAMLPLEVKKGWALMEGALVQAESLRRVQSRVQKQAAASVEQAVGAVDAALGELDMTEDRFLNEQSEQEELFQAAKAKQQVLVGPAEALKVAQGGLVVARKGREKGEALLDSIRKRRDQVKVDAAAYDEARAELVGDLASARDALKEVSARIDTLNTAVSDGKAREDALQERLDALNDAADLCPTCLSPLSEDKKAGLIEGTDTNITAAMEELEGHQETLRTARKQAGDAKRDIEGANAALEGLGGMPDVAFAESNVAETEQMVADAKADEKEAKAAVEAAGATAAEDLAAAQVVLTDARTKLQRFERAAKAMAAAAKAGRDLEKEQADYKYWDNIVDTWRKLISDLASERVEPLLAVVNQVLADQGKDWTATWASNGVYIQGPWAAHRALDSLSTGEQMLVGAAWQIAFAQHIGMGLATLDDASVLDVEALQDFLESVVGMAEGESVHFIVATTHPPIIIPDGVDVVRMADGERAE